MIGLRSFSPQLAERTEAIGIRLALMSQSNREPDWCALVDDLRFVTAKKPAEVFIPPTESPSI